MLIDNIIFDDLCQELDPTGAMIGKDGQPIFLNDTDKNGKNRPWKEKKIKNMELMQSYQRVGYDAKADRVVQCGDFLTFSYFEGGEIKLTNAHFCQVRLCPLCAWRREMKIFAQLLKVVEVVQERDYRFVFLTLTCKNVAGIELNDQISMLMKSFKRLTELKAVKGMAKGWFRALEITHDTEKKITKDMYKKSKKYYDRIGLKAGDANPNFNMYHPHFHVMIAVNKSYFSGNGIYIKQSQWAEMWQQSMRVDYTPTVDIRTVKNRNNADSTDYSKGVKETAKYTIKDADYIVESNHALTDEAVETLDNALDKRRLVAYGGIMKTIHKELNLDEAETAEVHITEDGEILEQIKLYELGYKWHVGYKNYALAKVLR